MEKFALCKGKPAVFMVEDSAEAGIIRVADKVVGDFNKVTHRNDSVKKVSSELAKAENAVLFANVETSELLKKFSKEGLISLKELKGKWEAYATFLISLPKEGIKNLLVIAGSDKLGTIYGMFALSEKMGISPLTYWADAVIPYKKELVVDIEAGFVAKEPSVKFRGFFINDEWPCYGNWTVDHFGGFTAEMYDNVFELLLRLKGNYLWPAMWSSSFALDGPGLKSYELADEYGIYIGNSHHEPCLRAGEEYSKVRGKGSIYGDAWNFHTNTEGITRFWRDSMQERGGFTSLVTVGMRGEADSKILGENATLKDNIDLLKKVIVCQKQIIHEAEEKFNKKFPMMLALYKEVEPFYYGDENTEGLCDWDELSDVTMMLCEDNYGYLRTVPDDKMRKHPAGFGMYYHVDYHGSPISYEWINSTPLNKIWEQMSQAYDYGVRNIWILNVGDLKHNEFPLSYFLNLAYDFDKWGTKAPNTTAEYTKEYMKIHFGGKLSDSQIDEASEILTETVRLNSYRRPEALNPAIYHPSHYFETDRLLKRVADLEEREKAFCASLKGDVKDAWFSLSGFQTRATVNLLRMHLYASKNNMYAMQGRKQANSYEELITRSIERDEALKQMWADFLDGKWKGMEMASHIGFTKWNEDGCRYPVRMKVEPFNRPRMQVARADSTRIYDKVYGMPMQIIIDDFCYEGEDSVPIVISNTGVGSLKFKIDMPDVKWLSVDATEGVVENEQAVLFSCDRSKLSTAKETVRVKISDGDTTVMAVISGSKLSDSVKKSLSDKTFLPGRFGYVMNAEHYASKKGNATLLEDYGVWGEGMKFYPDTTSYNKGSEPYLQYRLYAEEAGEYTAEVIFAPTNPLSRSGVLEYGLKVNDGEAVYANTVPAGFKSGEGSDRVWAEGALTHRRVLTQKVNLKKGINKVSVLMPDAGLVLLRVHLYKEVPPVSYLGPDENVFI